MSLQMCHMFVHNLHAIQLNSSHHSIHPTLQPSCNSSGLHSSWIHDVSVVLTCPICTDSWVSELVSDFKYLKTWDTSFRRFAFAWAIDNFGSFGRTLGSFGPPIVLFTRCLCQWLRTHSWTIHLHLKHPSRGRLHDAFPLSDERESLVENVPQHPWCLSVHARLVSLELGTAEILNQTGVSTYVHDQTRHASSKVRRRLDLRIKCLSSSSSTKASRPASLISSSILFFSFFSYLATQDSQRSSPAWSSRREQRPWETILRRRFLFRPPDVGPYRFCSLRHASNGCFRELATKSFASPLVKAINAVGICCSTNSRFCTPPLLLRRSRQEFTIDELCRDFRQLFSCPLQHHLGLLESLQRRKPRFLRPLL